MSFRPAAAFAALSLVLPGCFSSSNSPPPAPVDSGTPAVDAAAPVVDATTPMEAAVPPHDAAVEAALPEAAVEAAVPEAGPQPVTVRIINHMGPESGVLIVFQDAAGNVVTTGTTDATGTASALVASGTQVTAVMGYTPPAVVVGTTGTSSVSDQIIAPPTYVQLVTVEAVEPGDVLSLVDPSDTTYSNATVSIDALPDAAPPSGTASYYAEIGRCNSYFTVPPVQVSLSSDCETNGNFPLLIRAQGGADAGYADLGYTYQNHNTVPPDGGVAHVSANGPWLTTTTTQTITEINSPALSYSDQYASFSAIQDGVAYPDNFSVLPVDGGASATFPVYPGYAPFVQNEGTVTLYDNTYSFLQVSSIATRSPSSDDGGSVSLDLSTLLPFLSSVGFDGGLPSPPDAGPDAGDGGALGSAQPTVSWGIDGGSLASASGVVVQVSWYQYSTSGSGTWTIVAPPTTTQVQAPALPPSVAGWGPNSTSSFNQPRIVVVQGSFFTGYSDLRKQFAVIPATGNLLNGQPYSGPVVPPLPVDGTLRMTAYTINGD